MSPASSLKKALTPGHSSPVIGHVAEIVVDLPAGDLLGREADPEVVVEVASEGRHPFELPAHALAIALDLFERRARDRDHGDVVIGQMLVHAVGVIGHEGAARAAFLPSRPEHEMLHQKLRPAVEEIGQRARAVERIEHIFLFDAHPRQGEPLRGRPCREDG